MRNFTSLSKKENEKFIAHPVTVFLGHETRGYIHGIGFHSPGPKKPTGFPDHLIQLDFDGIALYSQRQKSKGVASHNLMP